MIIQVEDQCGGIEETSVTFEPFADGCDVCKWVLAWDCRSHAKRFTRTAVRYRFAISLASDAFFRFISSRWPQTRRSLSPDEEGSVAQAGKGRARVAPQLAGTSCTTPKGGTFLRI